MPSRKATRAPWHDYRSRCIYMITLSKGLEIPAFCDLTGTLEQPNINLSPLGKIIRNTIYNISDLHSAFRLLQYIVMPDHVHFILFVGSPLEEPLGTYIARLKVAINQQAGTLGIFTNGFNDQILRHSRFLNVIFQYIRQNPYRLAVRKSYPDYFRRIDSIKIGDKYYSTYGNQFLLQNPFIEQVVVHRSDDEAKRLADREQWLYTASNGGVLVSPFISPAEKAIRAEAEELGGRIILIINEPFRERFKPAAHDFEQCIRGKLLIIAPAAGSGTPLTRSACMAMNALAALVASKPG